MPPIDLSVNRDDLEDPSALRYHVALQSLEWHAAALQRIVLITPAELVEVFKDLADWYAQPPATLPEVG